MVSRRSLRLAFALVIGICAQAKTASAHPIHISYTEIRYRESDKTLEISLRVYANDFSAAAARSAGVTLRGDSTIDGRNALDYIRRNFHITDGSGRSLSPSACGIARAADMLKFCFRATVTAGLKGVRVRNTVMTELFGDQVNIVQSTGGKKRTSRLFVRGDGWKAL